MSSQKNKRMQVNWENYPRSLYLIHDVSGNDEEATKVELLAECTAPGRLTGHFGWTFGGGNLETSFRANRIVDIEEDFWLEFNIRPDDIGIRENSCAGHWEDLSDWVAKDKVGVLMNNEGARDSFLGKQTKFFYTKTCNSEYHNTLVFPL